MISAVFMSLAAQAAPAEPLQRWEHELVLHDDYEDFWADGAARGDASITATGIVISPYKRNDVHRADFEAIDYISPELVPSAPFHELLVSWNVDCPAGQGVSFEIRVGEPEASGWSPWLHVGDWGDPIPAGAPPGESAVQPSGVERVTTFDGGRIDVDYFVSTRSWLRAQYRVRSASHPGAFRQLANTIDRPRPVVSNDDLVRVRRVALCFSRRVEAGGSPAIELPSAARQRLPVPFRSQKVEKAEIAGRICSPTSVAMVMSYRGVDLPTAEVAARLYDSAHDIYGNWTRAVQGANSFGVPGYLARFGDWNEVAQRIAAGQPLVISIAAKAGELDGAPYPKTDGHLLVLCGFDERGDVLVNDPAAATADKGQLVYRREQLERVWLARGGTSYVLLPRER